ncbi:hypothetical protein F5Y05DRAFT_420714 [Hypoxylon sp. FL0543]|nr:hypothetical protein F5Y05DRAFT_420714 [Hypoxylon sp. FL0543]
MSPTVMEDGPLAEPVRDMNGRNVRHYQVPKYAPFGEYTNVQLYTRAYKPRDLLNFAVRAFYDREHAELSESQIEAYTSFLARFAGRKKAYGGKSRPNASLARFKDDVLYFFDCLDEFFFFKLLGPRVRVKSGLDVVGGDPLSIDERIEGETFPCKSRNLVYIQININIGSKGRLYKLDAILGQLMHEMVHAYFQLFACDCPSCSKDALNTVGVADDGHGPLFLSLHRLILSEIRNWGLDNGTMVALLADDCPGEFISKSASRRARKAIEKLTPDQRNKLNPVRSNNFSNYIIRLSQSGKRVLVQPSLIEKQLHWEKSLKPKSKRDMEGASDELDTNTRVRRWLLSIDSYSEDERGEQDENTGESGDGEDDARSEELVPP